MKAWIDRILLFVVSVGVTVLAISAGPWLSGGKLEGSWLLLHMMASGALVMALPLLALSCVWPNISRFRSGAMQRLGFWLLMLTGVTTIATVFLCMLPIPSSEEMHTLIVLHSYAGFAMVPALVLVLWGAARWRRIQSTRAATPG